MKRVLDIVVAALGLAILSPVLLGCAVAVRLSMGRPILFRQMRPGKDGKPFVLLKFRTMREAFAPDGTPLPDGDRITSVGKFLRSTSLDELPTLWNVLRAEMSLVGPRPLLMEYLPLYNARQARRHEVRPGVTGWAQVNGRNAISWEEKLEYDVWYVENRSFWLDLRILAMTVVRVLAREGISQPGHATMEPFRGSPGSGDTGPAQFSSSGAVFRATAISSAFTPQSGAEQG